MKTLFSNTSIYRGAIGIFVLVAIPVTFLTFYLLLSINHELVDIANDVEGYDPRIEVFQEVGLARQMTRKLRSLAPNYERGNDVTEYYRDLRLILIFLWGSTAVAGLTLVTHMALQISGRLSIIGRSIEDLLNQDLEKEVHIGGPLDLQSIETQLNRLRIQLRQNERQQLEFLQHVSHELKTPLTSIREGIKLIHDDFLGTMNHEQKEVSQIILKNSRELQSSIESLLDYNRALAARKETSRAFYQLDQLIEDAINHQALAVRSKNLNVRLHAIPASVQINSAQILTVFENLLSNAIKHSKENGDINITMTRNQKLISISIQDDGKGISNDERLTVFDAFFVGEAPSDGGLKSTGLGLSIVRQYIEMHQGTVEVLDPNRGQLSGALVQVSLPI